MQRLQRKKLLLRRNFSYVKLTGPQTVFGSAMTFVTINSYTACRGYQSEEYMETWLIN